MYNSLACEFTSIQPSAQPTACPAAVGSGAPSRFVPSGVTRCP
jgi:hypothetical protein